MNDNELKELQDYSFQILTEVHNFCRDNNIKYFLGEGTLLGAVRHNGFIPWDDDIDILMLREDFERFINNFKSEKLGIEYFNTMKYWTVFAKVRLLEETKFYSPRLEAFQKYTGPRIDIMPLDYFPNENTLKEKWIIKKMDILKILIRNKILPLTKKKYFLGYIIWLITRIIPYKFLVNQINKTMKKFSNNCKYVINYGSEYEKHKEVFPVEYFENAEEIKFCSNNFYISSSYDAMLKQIYGDYMVLPPKEKRVVKHYLKVRKSDNDA